MRKGMILVVSLALLALLLTAALEKFSNPSTPLNVVLIITDDQGAHLSALGTKGLSTPNMDELAREGTLFTNAFAVAASCSPSRAAMLTGMHPHANGLWRNVHTPTLGDDETQFTTASTEVDAVGVHEYLRTLPEILRANGYFSAITQKLGVGPPWKFPYDSRNPVWKSPESFKKVTAQFIDEAGDRPFFIQANISPPHRNFDYFTFPQSWQRYATWQRLPDPDAIEVPGYLADNPLMREDWREYLRSIQVADACVGAVLEALREKGAYNKTLIIFTSDNGEPYHRAKASPYYAGLHVPFIIKGPRAPKNRTLEALISHIDIMPTILDYLGLDIPESVQGHSLKPLLSGKTDTGRSFVFGEHHAHGWPREQHYPSRAVFDGRFYYIQNLMPDKGYALPLDLRQEEVWGNRSHQATLQAEGTIQHRLLKQLESGRPSEELYDMENDPWQLVNLADSEQHRRKLEELKLTLKEWRNSTGDEADDPLEIKTRQTQEPLTHPS